MVEWLVDSLRPLADHAPPCRSCRTTGRWTPSLTTKSCWSSTSWPTTSPTPPACSGASYQTG